MDMQSDIDRMDIYLAHLSSDKRSALKDFHKLLMHFNAKMNLVSASTAATAVKHHFADSVMGLELVTDYADLKGDIYDFGSGNGFPGVVLAMLRPELDVIMVEKDQRKVEFLKYIIAELKLKNAGVFPETMDRLPKASIQFGVTRAMASVSKMLIHANSLFIQNGVLFHFKGENWTTELAQCPTQVFSKWDIQPVGQYSLPESSTERFIVASKLIS